MFDTFMENWELFLTSIIAISAFICAFLNTPTEDSSSIYKIFYSILNYLAFNINKAENKEK